MRSGLLEMLQAPSPGRSGLAAGLRAEVRSPLRGSCSAALEPSCRNPSDSVKPCRALCRFFGSWSVSVWLSREVFLPLPLFRRWFSRSIKAGDHQRLGLTVRVATIGSAGSPMRLASMRCRAWSSQRRCRLLSHCSRRQPRDQFRWPGLFKRCQQPRQQPGQNASRRHCGRRVRPI